MFTLIKNKLNQNIDLSVIKHYEKESLIIPSIDSKLVPLEKKIRRYIMDYIIEEKKPYNLKNIDNNLLCNIGVTKGEFRNIVLRLNEKKVLVMDEKENINFIYPVSAMPTNYKVKLQDGREIKAMCAVDSIGTAFTFKQNIKIESSCIMCNEPIEVIIKNGEIKKCIPEKLRVLHIDLNKSDSWASSCWNVMYFFCSEEHYKNWVKEANPNEDDMFCLDIYEAVCVAKMLFSVSD